MIVEIDEKKMKESKGYLLVDFWAPWCGPCRNFTPVLEAVDKKIGDQVTISKLNIDEHPEVASTLHITTIPTIILFKDGVKQDQHIGSMLENQLEEWLLKRIK